MYRSFLYCFFASFTHGWINILPMYNTDINDSIDPDDDQCGDCGILCVSPEHFWIEQKYGLNKRTKKEFWKDYLIDTGMGAVIMVCVLSFITFACEHIRGWTGDFSYTFGQTFLLCVGLALVGFVIMLVLSLLSLVALMAQYSFTELEDGPLRQRIMELQKDSKKKVKHIKIYNESKKTNSKNAFLMKLLWFRMFGIADNFILENAQNELYAVLSHEIGHLKHKKDIFNYSKYGILALGFSFGGWCGQSSGYYMAVQFLGFRILLVH